MGHMLACAYENKIVILSVFNFDVLQTLLVIVVVERLNLFVVDTLSILLSKGSQWTSEGPVVGKR